MRGGKTRGSPHGLVLRTNEGERLGSHTLSNTPGRISSLLVASTSFLNFHCVKVSHYAIPGYLGTQRTLECDPEQLSRKRASSAVKGAMPRAQPRALARFGPGEVTVQACRGRGGRQGTLF